MGNLVIIVVGNQHTPLMMQTMTREHLEQATAKAYGVHCTAGAADCIMSQLLLPLLEE
jgi:hypothetical protein